MHTLRHGIAQFTMAGGIKTNKSNATVELGIYMNKTLIIALLATSPFAFSDNLIREDWNAKPMVPGNRRVDEIVEWHKIHPGVMPPLTDQEKYEIFTKNGIPLPGSGANVVSSGSIRANKEQTSYVNKFNKEQREKGYVSRPSKNAARLLKMPASAEEQFEAHKLKALAPTDTHLRETINELPMNYPYKGVPRNLYVKNIGYAAEHTYVGDGWTGAVQFFIPNFNAVCAYHEVNIELTHSSVLIPMDVARYDVNKKITMVNVSGEIDTGFSYNVEWWDNKFKRNLECASKDYNEIVLKNTIELAKLIDKN